MNVVVLIGTLSHDPQTRDLPSGDSVVTFDLTTRPDEGPAESVPIACFLATATTAALQVGDEVVVTGRVRRRFFRAGGVTQSRTEVIAEQVVRARQAKRRSTLLSRAAEAILT